MVLPITYKTHKNVLRRLVMNLFCRFYHFRSSATAFYLNRLTNPLIILSSKDIEQENVRGDRRK
jgi:hypothetical protein